MKTFTLAEANSLLAEIEPTLRMIRDGYARLTEMSPDARAAAAHSRNGGGMQGGTSYVNTLYELGRLSTELADLGIELKDQSRGLIDFPSLRNGRVVYLCWQFDDGGDIGFWHETDGGFAGRQPI